MTLSPTPIHDAVRDHYAERARNSSSCCSPTGCGSNELYAETLLADLPSEIVNFTLGCGDPITLANLRPGETVLDLGSGGGLDCFLAARQVGPQGRVIGIDMTPEMLAKARANAARLNAANVEFREGYLEKLPVADNSIDVVISNCVINLSPDKPQVFREIFRVLRQPDLESGRPGGRVSISDIVISEGSLMPEAVQKNMAAWGACVAGALNVNDYVQGLLEAGFTEVRVQPKGDTDRVLAAFPIGLPFSASITASKSQQAEVIACTAPGGVSSRRPDLEALLSHIIDITPINSGYEFQLAGDPAETRPMVEAFIRAEATCCSFLHFNLIETPSSLRLQLTGSPAALEFAEDLLNGAKKE